MADEALLKEYVWESTKEVFETMICLPVERSDNGAEVEPSELMICVITFQGPLEGAFSARCAMGCAENIARAMLMSGDDDSLSGPEICDAFGEVVNMLIGGWKARMNETVRNIQISIPSVVKGLDIEPTMGRGASKFDVGVAVGGEAMTLTVMYRSRE